MRCPICKLDAIPKRVISYGRLRPTGQRKDQLILIFALRKIKSEKKWKCARILSLFWLVRVNSRRQTRGFHSLVQTFGGMFFCVILNRPIYLDTANIIWAIFLSQKGSRSQNRFITHSISSVRFMPFNLWHTEPQIRLFEIKNEIKVSLILQ